VLQHLGRAASATVYLSVPTTDEDAWRTLEPGTAHPLKRLKAVRALVDAGIDAGVLMAPLVPGFSTSPAKIDATVKAIADHGARFVGANVLFLDGATRGHFMRFLGRQFPAMVDGYGRLYASKRAPKDYVERVQKTVGMLKARYGVAPSRQRTRARGGQDAPESSAAPSRAREASQGAFAWKPSG
jgi:prepilin-type processing-associated H-X9-DG protein